MEASQRALEGYTALVEPLTPEQRRELAVPQERVVDHRALGLDSAGVDVVLVWLHRMDERASGSSEAAPPQKPAPAPMRMSLTRLAAAMTRLLDDPSEPITAAQARAILENEIRLRKTLETVHALHARARRLLSAAQRSEAKALPLRRWESFPSPRGLELFVEMVRERRKGAKP